MAQDDKPKATKDERDQDQVERAALGNSQVGMKQEPGSGDVGRAPANPYPDIKADPTADDKDKS